MNQGNIKNQFIITNPKDKKVDQHTSTPTRDQVINRWKEKDRGA